MVYSQCSADIAWPCPCLLQCCWLLFFPNIILLQNWYFSALFWVFSPALSLDVLFGHFSLLNIESGLFCSVVIISSLFFFFVWMFLLILHLNSGSSVYFIEDEKAPGLFGVEIFWSSILCVRWTCTITFRPSVVVWECLGKRVCFIFFISWGTMILHSVSVSGQCWHHSLVRKHQAAKLSARRGSMAPVMPENNPLNKNIPVQRL